MAEIVDSELQFGYLLLRPLDPINPLGSLAFAGFLSSMTEDDIRKAKQHGLIILRLESYDKIPSIFMIDQK